jgi:glycosylphosphatidylinositol transamidase
MNNLLERLHASFFFYLMTGSGSFLKVGFYLPSAVILSAAITITGLDIWYKMISKSVRSPAGDKQAGDLDESKLGPKRPVIAALLVMLASHVVGFAFLLLLKLSWVADHASVRL